MGLSLGRRGGQGGFIHGELVRFTFPLSDVGRQGGLGAEEGHAASDYPAAV